MYSFDTESRNRLVQGLYKQGGTSNVLNNSVHLLTLTDDRLVIKGYERTIKRTKPSDMNIEHELQKEDPSDEVIQHDLLDISVNVLYHRGRFVNDVTIEQSVVLSGSFNPFHYGHQSLMDKAQDFLNLPYRVYELSVKNADKGKINSEEVVKRISSIPDPVMLTCSALFTEKCAFIKE